MAAPHAAGVAALLAARDPSLTVAQIKADMLAGVDPIAGLTGRAVTGGRLNAAGALARVTDTTAPPVPAAVTATGGTNQVRLTWSPSTAEDLAGYRVYIVDANGTTRPAPVATPIGADLGRDRPRRRRTGPPARLGHRPRRQRVRPVGRGHRVRHRRRGGDACRPDARARRPHRDDRDRLRRRRVRPDRGRRARQRPRDRLRRGCKRRSATLRFSLGADATLRVTAARKVCTKGRCSYKAAGTRTLRLSAGPHHLTIASSLAGIRLRAGTWRVTLATSADDTTAAFTVRAH